MKHLKHNEQGLVSIMVTMVMMIVISITVLSFAQIIRREQRQALDNHLSTQAFYAAETGINDARTILKQHGLDSKTTCDGTLKSQPLDYVINDTTSYTCLLVNPAPDSLAGPVTANSQSWVTPIQPSEELDYLHLSWTPQANESETAGNPTDNCPPSIANPNANKFEPSDNWGCTGYGVLRIDLVPTSGSLSRSGLMRNTHTMFVYPTTNSASSTVAYVASNGATGRLERARCDDDSCKLSIDLRSAPNGQYYMRTLAFYRNTNMTVTGNNGDVTFSNSQVVIDSTGKAQDVLRRIQVRVPITGGDHPDYAIQTTNSLCKQFEAYYRPGDTASSAYQNDTTSCGEDGTVD